MGKLLDRLILPLTRRRSALLFDALKRAEAQRSAARLAREAITDAAETPAEEAAPPVTLPEAK